MKKTLIRALSFCMILALLTGLMAPFASAIDYEGVEPITLEAAAGLLIDLDTDQVLYEQNADGQRYPASITKIMTALLTLEAVGRGELDLSTVVTVDAAALKDLTSDSSTANLKAGEEITVHDLLYCLMLASANEAANILAMTVCGDIPTFVERMNQRAQELGMTGTHFMNPHGLHNSEHYSTAWDIYRMAKEAMTHAAFREIVSTARYVVPATNMSGERVLLNTNALLTSAKFPGYTFSGTIGIKTGSTGEAGYCLVAAAKKKGHTLVSVVLGADNPTGANGKVKIQKAPDPAQVLQRFPLLTARAEGFQLFRFLRGQHPVGKAGIPPGCHAEQLPCIVIGIRTPCSGKPGFHGPHRFARGQTSNYHLPSSGSSGSTGVTAAMATSIMLSSGSNTVRCCTQMPGWRMIRVAMLSDRPHHLSSS